MQKITRKLDKKDKKQIKIYIKGKDTLPADGFAKEYYFADGSRFRIHLHLSSANTPTITATLIDPKQNVVGEIRGESEFEGIWVVELDDEVYTLDLR